MTDEEKDQKEQELEQLPPEKLRKQIEKDKRKAARSTVFAVAALIALIAIGIAWFVYNNVVKGTTGRIGARNDQPFLLASMGVRQKVEESELVDDNSQKMLSGGTAKEYTKYIDVETGLEKSGGITLHEGTSGLAWYLNGQAGFSPGAGGKLEFYLIPQRDGLTSATLSINLSAYEKKENSLKATESTNTVLQNLLKGHVLLFQKLNDEKGYVGWLGEDGSFKVEQNFQKDVPYKITVYWKWPQYFRNYIYTQRSTQGDLFTDLFDENTYRSVTKFVKKQQNKASEKNKLFYDEKSIIINGDINNQMSDEVLNACTQYYNQADEYIGNNAKYIYVGMEVQNEG